MFVLLTIWVMPICHRCQLQTALRLELCKRLAPEDESLDQTVEEVRLPTKPIGGWKREQLECVGGGSVYVL